MRSSYGRRHDTDRILRVLTVGICLLVGTPHAASERFERFKQYLATNINLDGMAGLHGEGYYTTADDDRRPPATGRLTLTPTLNVLNLLTLSADVMISTDESYARQNMSVLGLHPTWKWGKAHIGDYTESLSKYSFNGVNVKGLELDLFPAKWRFTLGGGRTQRAVSGDITTRAFAQYLVAGRFGYGERNGNYMDIVVLKVRDDPGSLDDVVLDTTGQLNPDTLITELDTIWQNPPENPYAVTPQENLVGGITGQLSLWRRRIVLGAELCGSAFTRDLGAATVDASDIGVPDAAADLFESVYATRTSTVADYALSTKAALNLPMLRADVGYNLVGPGYVSLGTSSTANDRQELTLNASGNVKTTRMQVGYSFMADNLAGQETSTNTRNQLRASVSSALNKWQSQYGANYLALNNDASVDSLGWDYDNLTFNTYQGIAFGRDLLLRQIGLQYTYQTSRKDMHTDVTRSTYHTSSLAASLRLIKLLTLNLNAGLSYRDPEQGDSYLTQVYGGRLAMSVFENRWSNALSVNSSMVRETRVVRAGLTSSYRFTKAGQVSLNISYNRFNGSRFFEELRGTLSVTHRR